MSLPRKLKLMNVFHNGASYAGEAKNVVLPNITRKLEAWRGGGMLGPVGIDMGSEDLMEIEAVFGGYMRSILNGVAAETIDAEQLRWVGAFEDDATGEVLAIEVVTRGRWQELDRGDQKVGEDGEFKAKGVLAYYKEIHNGQTVYEEDRLNNVLIVNGVDKAARLRNAIQA